MNAQVTHTPGLTITARTVHSSDGRVVCRSGLYDVRQADGTLVLSELTERQANIVVELFDSLVDLSDLACRRCLSRTEPELRKAIETIHIVSGKTLWSLRS